MSLAFLCFLSFSCMSLAFKLFFWAPYPLNPPVASHLPKQYPKRQRVLANGSDAPYNNETGFLGQSALALPRSQLDVLA